MTPALLERAPSPVALLRAEVERGLDGRFHLVLVNPGARDALEVEVWVQETPAPEHRAWKGPAAVGGVPARSSVSYPNALSPRRSELPLALRITWTTPEGRRREIRTEARGW
jgi:hypothetical protein